MGGAGWWGGNGQTHLLRVPGRRRRLPGFPEITGLLSDLRPIRSTASIEPRPRSGMPATAGIPCGRAWTPAGGWSCPAPPGRPGDIRTELPLHELAGGGLLVLVAELFQGPGSVSGSMPLSASSRRSAPLASFRVWERLRTHMSANSASSMSRTSSKRSSTASATSSGMLRSASLRASCSRLLAEFVSCRRTMARATEDPGPASRVGRARDPSRSLARRPVSCRQSRGQDSGTGILPLCAAGR